MCMCVYVKFIRPLSIEDKIINQIAKKGLKNEKMFLCEFVMGNLEKRCILKKKFDVSGIWGSNDMSR